MRGIDKKALNGLIAYYTCFIAAYLGVWLLFMVDVDKLYPIKQFVTRSFVDVAAASLVCLILLPRTKWLPIAIVWLEALFCLCNVCYYRFFDECISMRMITYVGNLDSVTLGSLKVGFRLSDLIYILLPLALTLAYLFFYSPRFKNQNLSTKGFRVYIAALLCLLILGSQAMYLRSLVKYYKSVDKPCLKETVIDHYVGANISPVRSVARVGLPMHLLIQTVSFIKNRGVKLELSEKDLTEINNFIDKRRNDIKIDSIFQANENKNLIFIVVESLNGDAVGAIKNGLQITPTLDKLISTAEAFYSTEVECQVGEGASSDGQFIYNTGLLPLQKGAVAMDYPKNTYQSIAKELSRTSLEVICEGPTLWNHNVTNRQYGFDRLYTVRDIEEKGFAMEEIGSDAALFRYALSLMPDLQKPFYMFLTTLSMHSPFTPKGFDVPTQLETDPSLSDLEKRYFASVNYFDRCLGDFLDELKKVGEYDKSIIVIASDHDFSVSSDRLGTNNGPIVFMALNTGVARNIGKMEQVDVYPTILNLMGMSPEWPGVGQSVVNKEPKNTIFESESSISQRAISDKIIRGDFFHVSQ